MLFFILNDLLSFCCYSNENVGLIFYRVFICRLSEDSGDMPSYPEDSEDSNELEIEERGTGQMNLLEEILDSLSASNVEQGSRLSAAKSLDFFRSTDEIDFSTSVRVELAQKHV